MATTNPYLIPGPVVDGAWYFTDLPVGGTIGDIAILGTDSLQAYQYTASGWVPDNDDIPILRVTLEDGKYATLNIASSKPIFSVQGTYYIPTFDGTTPTISGTQGDIMLGSQNNLYGYASGSWVSLQQNVTFFTDLYGNVFNASTGTIPALPKVLANMYPHNTNPASLTLADGQMALINNFTELYQYSFGQNWNLTTAITSGSIVTGKIDGQGDDVTYNFAITDPGFMFAVGTYYPYTTLVNDANTPIPVGPPLGLDNTGSLYVWTPSTSGWLSTTFNDTNPTGNIAQYEFTDVDSGLTYYVIDGDVFIQELCVRYYPGTTIFPAPLNTNKTQYIVLGNALAYYYTQTNGSWVSIPTSNRYIFHDIKTGKIYLASENNVTVIKPANTYAQALNTKYALQGLTDASPGINILEPAMTADAINISDSYTGPVEFTNVPSTAVYCPNTVVITLVSGVWQIDSADVPVGGTVSVTFINYVDGLEVVYSYTVSRGESFEVQAYLPYSSTNNPNVSSTFGSGPSGEALSQSADFPYEWTLSISDPSFSPSGIFTAPKGGSYNIVVEANYILATQVATTSAQPAFGLAVNGAVVYIGTLNSLNVNYNGLAGNYLVTKATIVLDTILTLALNDQVTLVYISDDLNLPLQVTTPSVTIFSVRAV